MTKSYFLLPGILIIKVDMVIINNSDIVHGPGQDPRSLSLYVFWLFSGIQRPRMSKTAFSKYISFYLLIYQSSLTLYPFFSRIILSPSRPPVFP